MQKPSISPDPTKAIPKGGKPKAGSITISNRVNDDESFAGQDVKIYLIGEAEDPTFAYKVTVGVGDEVRNIVVKAENPDIAANPLVGQNDDNPYSSEADNTINGTVIWDDFAPGFDPETYIPVNFELEVPAKTTVLKRESFFRRLINAIIKFFS